MWPWGHLAVGYLLYSLGLRRVGRRPESPEVFLVALGTLFPDLVDKPLTWYVGVLPSGRSLTHSVLVAAVVLAVLYVVLAPRVGRSPIVAFGVGWVSHSLADFPFERALAGEFEFLSYLLWPLLPPPQYGVERTLLDHLVAYQLGPFELFEFVLVGIAAAVWYRDGRPGWTTLRQAARPRRSEAPRR